MTHQLITIRGCLLDLTASEEFPMAQQQQGQCEHQERNIGFKSVQLFKDQTLGIGSYGAVCKAKCDDLLCAAKILHPTLFDPTALLQVSPKQEHRLPIKRFEQECEFLSTIRHPNIVQYLCMHQDQALCVYVCAQTQ